MTKRKLGIYFMWLSLVVAIGAALYTLFGHTLQQPGPGAVHSRPAKAVVGFAYIFPALMAALAAGFVPFFLGVYLWASGPDEKK